MSLTDIKERIETIFKIIADNAKRIEELNVKIEKHLTRGEGVLEDVEELKKACKLLSEENTKLHDIYMGITIERDTIRTMKNAFWIKIGVIATILTGVGGVIVYFK